MLGVNHTFSKCCFVHRRLISLVAAYGRPEIANHLACSRRSDSGEQCEVKEHFSSQSPSTFHRFLYFAPPPLSERLEQATNHSEAFAAATWTLCYREGLDYYRIVVLFDCYQRQSIKAMTKSRRSKNIPQIVGRVIARREVPLQVFLALGDKKAHLARSLSDERIAQAAGDTTIVVSGGCSN